MLLLPYTRFARMFLILLPVPCLLALFVLPQLFMGIYLEQLSTTRNAVIMSLFFAMCCIVFPLVLIRATPILDAPRTSGLLVVLVMWLLFQAWLLARVLGNMQDAIDFFGEQKKLQRYRELDLALLGRRILTRRGKRLRIASWTLLTLYIMAALILLGAWVWTATLRRDNPRLWLAIAVVFWPLPVYAALVVSVGKKLEDRFVDSFSPSPDLTALARKIDAEHSAGQELVDVWDSPQCIAPGLYSIPRTLSRYRIVVPRPVIPHLGEDERFRQPPPGKGNVFKFHHFFDIEGPFFSVPAVYFFQDGSLDGDKPLAAPR